MVAIGYLVLSTEQLLQKNITDFLFHTSLRGWNACLSCKLLLYRSNT